MVTFGLVPFGLVPVTFGLRVFGPCDNGYIWCRTAGRNRDVSVSASIDTNSTISSSVAIDMLHWSRL